MEHKIFSFIAKHHLFTLATAIDDTPYAASCFYAFDKRQKALIFASESQTTHMRQALLNPKVAGTIAKPTFNIASIQGVQFQGKIKRASKAQEALYYTRFPFAVAMRPTLWIVELHWVKMTDNQAGFKTKYEWSKPPDYR